jgi:hypothetical protein
MVLTRAQFETMVSSINITNQAYTLPALRNIGSGYVTVLALADAGEKAGIDKDPRFQEFMKVAHTRALADAYRRYLQEKYGNPTAEEIAEYYKQNASKFELTKIERVLIPKVNPLRSQDKPAEFEKKARELSTALHERAARGEDMSALQVEAYKTLGVQAMPPQTEISPNQKGAIQPAVQQEINALKPGEVTKVEFEPSGFNIYKLRSRTTIPLEQAKADIVKELSQKNIDAALKAATGHVHSEFNEQFFNPGPAVAPPNHRVPLRMRTPASAPTSGTVAPAVPPVASGSPAPPASSSSPVPQKPAPPK